MLHDWPFGAMPGVNPPFTLLKTEAKALTTHDPKASMLLSCTHFVAAQWHPMTKFPKRYLKGKYRAFTKVTILS